MLVVEVLVVGTVDVVVVGGLDVGVVAGVVVVVEVVSGLASVTESLVAVGLVVLVVLVVVVVVVVVVLVVLVVVVVVVVALRPNRDALEGLDVGLLGDPAGGESDEQARGSPATPPVEAPHRT